MIRATEITLKNTDSFLLILLFATPFLRGGFDMQSCAAIGVILLIYLLLSVRKAKRLQVYLSGTVLSLCGLSLCYSVSFLWGADQGMAAWGIVKFFPVICFLFAMMQMDVGGKERIYRFVPLGAVVMTLISLLLKWIPATRALVTVDGRLSGFFEYPNTYSALLIVALILSAFELRRYWRNICVDLILMYGILESGSRTGFLIMLGILILLMLVKRDKKYFLSTVGVFGSVMGISWLLNQIGVESSADRYLAISGQSSTFLGRLLYFSDAWKLIVKNPLGLGYMGYRAVQGSIQTGMYDVTHVHNWLLQILLDVGWIPGLLMAWTVLKSVLVKRNSWKNRLILLAIFGHGLMDFDMEYLSMWFLVLPALDYGAEKPWSIKREKRLLAYLAGVAAAVSVWLALGDGMYRMGQIDACLAITPFHTEAMEYKLTTITDVAELDAVADDILRWKPSSSIAYSAKSNAAFASGEIRDMIDNKQMAISCRKYAIEEYCDYFEKLYRAREWYLTNGDPDSAQVCVSYLEQIPELLQALEWTTSPLAWKLTDQPVLELPEEYRTLLAELAGLT